MTKDYKKGLFKSGAVSALRPLNLEVPTSTVLCMLGHNGGENERHVVCLHVRVHYDMYECPCG